ncbi:MAG: radical SAM protein [Candidatus Omnitrophota bacterium]
MLGQAGGSEPPLGLCYLAAAVRKEGFTAGIIDAQAQRLGLKETMELIKAFEPCYVGITASTMAIESAAALARDIKVSDPGIKIIIGGCHISSLPAETFAEYKFFDIGVIGEGEDTVRELLLALENNMGLKDIKGIAIRENGSVYLSLPRPRIKDLDSLAYPAFDLLPDIRRFYRLPAQSLADSRSFSLVTSRGCMGKCSFCDKKVFGNYISMHSAEYITEMIRILNQDYKITNIMFEDDNFMASRQRLKDIADLMAKKKLKTRCTVLARMDNVDEESLKILKGMGCWQISYGIESGSQRILDFYNKGITVQQIRNVAGLTKSAGLKVKCFFIWGNPTEDRESIRETADLVKNSGVDDISVTFFTPFPGSEIWPDIRSYGDFDKNWEKMSCFELVFRPYGLEKEYLINSRKKILRDFYFRPKLIFSYLIRIRSLAQLKELILSAYCLFRYILKGVE